MLYIFFYIPLKHNYVQKCMPDSNRNIRLGLTVSPANTQESGKRLAYALDLYQIQINK